MNQLEGEITNIKTSGSLSLVEINVGAIFFNTIIIENPNTASYLKKGNDIKVIFKETEVIIAKGIEPQTSIQNKVIGEITFIEKGELLTKLTIDTALGKIIAIITSDAMRQLQLQIGERITAMIQANEIILSK